MSPQWAVGANILQHHVHLAILDVLGPQWALGTTMWTTSISIHFQTLHVPNEPWDHFILTSYTSSRSMHYVSPLSLGSHQASTPFTFSYFGRFRSPVSHRRHYINRVKIYPFSDILCPQWALRATLYQCHVLQAVQCAMCPHWAAGPTHFIYLYV